jgi:hypothetical protein
VDLTSIKAKIAAGALPATNGIAVHRVRYLAGVCAACDETFSSDAIGGVQFDAGSGGRLLHVDCYVMWSEACAH